MARNLYRRLAGGGLQRQLTLGVTLLVASLMSFFFWDINRYQLAAESEQANAKVMALARSLAVASASGLAARDSRVLLDILDGAASFPDFEHAMVLDLQGKVLAHTDTQQVGQTVADFPSKLQSALSIEKDNYREAISLITQGNEPLGWVKLRVSNQSQQIRRQEITRDSVNHLLMALALSAFFAALGSRYMVRRLTAISQVAHAVEAGDTRLRASVAGDDETADLARNFNAMLDTLSQRDHALKDSEAFKSTILDSVSAEIAVLDRQGFIVAVNDQWHRFSLGNGVTPAQQSASMGVGTNYLQACAQAISGNDVFASAAKQGIEDVLSGRLGRFDLDYPCHAPHQRRWFNMTVVPLGQAADHGVVVAHSDISRVKFAEQYEAFRSQVLELMASDIHLQALLRAMVTGLEQLYPDMLCSAVLLSSDGLYLGQTVAPSLPAFFNEAIVGLPIGVGQGSCGTAAATGERVVAADIATHPYWEKYRALAQRAGLAACWSQPIFSGDGSVLGTFAIYYQQVRAPTDDDIVVMQKTARLAGLAIDHKRTLSALQTREYTFRTLFETAPVGIVYQDSDAKITSVNPAAERILGMSLSQMQGRTSMDPRWHAIHEDGSPYPGETHPVVVALHTGQSVHDIMAVESPGRGRVWISVTGTPLFEGDKVVQAYAVFEDITERYLLQQQVRQLAFYDTLTQLPNRRLLVDRLGQTLAACKRSGNLGALMFLDLDNFKPLNDAHGHEAGDLLLKEVARRLRACVREQDTVARIGGDEFVVMLTDLHAEPSLAGPHACSIANKICVGVAAPYELACQQADGSTRAVQHHCTASVGVTLFSAADADHEQILRRADAAMYLAKDHGRNRVVFESSPC